MSIIFIVEDGSGKDDATSYGTIEDYKQYWENRGVDYSAVADATLQALMNRATALIGQRYCFKGEIKTTDQALDFPRYYLYDKNCREVSSDSVPTQVQNATFEIAKQVYDADQQKGSVSDPNANPEGITSKTIGLVSLSYGAGSSGVNSPILYTNATMYLKPFLDMVKRV